MKISSDGLRVSSEDEATPKLFEVVVAVRHGEDEHGEDDYGKDELEIHWLRGPRDEPVAAHEDLIQGYWDLRTKRAKRERADWVDSLLTEKEARHLERWLAGPGRGTLRDAGFTVTSSRTRQVLLPVPKAAQAGEGKTPWDFAGGGQLFFGKDQDLPFAVCGRYLLTERMKVERLRASVAEGRQTVAGLQGRLSSLLALLAEAEAAVTAGPAVSTERLREAHEQYLRFRAQMAREFWCG